MKQSLCPRCSSPRRSEGYRVGPNGNYTCRDSWHMPRLSEEELSAVVFAHAVDVMVSADPYGLDQDGRLVAR